jgi:LmbE family N-acetylglucosaminyl deacetylase
MDAAKRQRAAFRLSLGNRCISVVTCWLVSMAAQAAVLVIAPHPDDDVIAGAGVIHRAAGYEEVTVVYMTNGDIHGTAEGYVRQDEAVSAQVQHLGLVEDNLVFLGYPDGRLRRIFNDYTTPLSRYITPFGQGVTYGDRGLGRLDYHSYRFGAPASYNRPNIVTDLATILQAYRPDHIYSPSEFDQHTDHATTYRLLRLALDQVHAQDPSYAPVIHKTIIWSTDPSIWPAPADPTAYLGETPGLGSTSLRWADRASLDVPVPMQNRDLGLNLKYQATLAHASQASDAEGFILKFTHKDEIFWSENPFGDDQPPVAEAGPNVFAVPGEFARLKGQASRDPEGASLVFEWTQVAGSPVLLQNANTASPGFLVPANAALTDYWSFRLSVRDGSTASASDMAHVFAGTQQQNIALIADVTASSQNANTGQLARKAVDGVVDGYPGDYTREWATRGQAAGAWIRLDWSTPYTVDRVVLYDRPNSNDQVLAGTLGFSDGSAVAVGPLTNEGAGVTVTFAPRAVTGVEFSITSVSAATSNVGLAEIQVYGDAGPASFTLSPTSLAFGNQMLNVASSKTVVVTNTAGVALPITSISISGTNAGQFSRTHDCGSSVPAGGTCSITVTFKPTNKGAKVATLSVSADGGASTSSVALSGTGVAASIEVSPSSIAFGNVPRNTVGGPRAVTVSNLISSAVGITSITLSGSNPGKFAQTNDCPGQLPAGDSCTINVVFKPTARGSRTATLKVTPATGPARSVSLSGTGT